MIVGYVLDHIIPPILREFRFFMYLVLLLPYGRKTKLVLDFKEKFPFMTDVEITEYYNQLKTVPLNKRNTDLNKKSLAWILENISTMTGTVLDAACGKGYLLSKIIESNPNLQCHGVDFAPPDEICRYVDGRLFFDIKIADIAELPFEDHSFDVVLCTHALEHVRNPKKALDELIRVTRQRLIVVVPRQREYRYTGDLHVNFFPYMYSFKRFVGLENAMYLDIKGDLICCMDF